MDNSVLYMPTLPLRGIVVFPYMTISLDVGREKAIHAIEKAVSGDQLVFLVSQIEATLDEPTREDLHDYGTVARIKQILKMPGDIVRILVEGLYRAELIEFIDQDNIYAANIAETANDEEPDKAECEAYIRVIMTEFEEYAKISGKITPETFQSAQNTNEPGHFADMIAANVLENISDKYAVLSTLPIVDRLGVIYDCIRQEVDIQNIEQKIYSRVKKQMDKSQREYYLREQLKAIHKELGDSDGKESDELRELIQNSDMSEEAKTKALKELDRMGKMASGMPEISLIRNYIDWLLDIPWTHASEDNLDLINARQILDEDHYGMVKVKERIIEYLAVCKLKNNLHGPILCFVGPPGVGKTSIAKSIARALGRSFVRMSLGGVRDEAEIRGHRRTYVGAIPGRIISSMKLAKSINPVFLFDEIEKMSSDFRGDPASAMLEVLDKEQNNTFRDHYLEVPYDLSKVLFVATANSIDSIPKPLLDRMEIISLSSYTDVEKLHIAKEHLIPNQLLEHGIEETAVKFEDGAILEIINSYTREAGVRNLEREIASVCRKIATKIVSKDIKKLIVRKSNLKEYLGVPNYMRESTIGENQIGTVTGLAWTSVGGETLTIDAALMPGNGELVLTGQLGDVMKESAKTALGLIRTNSEAWGINPAFNKDLDIHIHIPEGATPKDGPSAGITMATALVSSVTGIPVRSDTAMTGEITLRGRVLPIGGLKEKSLAAYRLGIKRIIIPAKNQKDLEEIPKEVKSHIEYIPVSDFNDVLANALEHMPEVTNAKRI